MAAARPPPAKRAPGTRRWMLAVVAALWLIVFIIAQMTLRPRNGGGRVGAFLRRLSRRLSLRQSARAEAVDYAPPLRGTLSDPDPIHVVYAACGNPSDQDVIHASNKDSYGLLGVKSILMAKAHNPGMARHYVFHIITNVREEELFNTTWLNWEVWRALEREAATGLVSYHTYRLEDLDAAVKDVLGPTDPNLSVPHTIFKNCAASRLKLPFLLGPKNITRVVYMDWDSVALCDLTSLWRQWPELEASSPDAILGFANVDPTGSSARDVYRMHSLSRHPDLGAINSGVMLMHIGRMARALGVPMGGGGEGREAVGGNGSRATAVTVHNSGAWVGGPGGTTPAQAEGSFWGIRSVGASSAVATSGGVAAASTAAIVPGSGADPWRVSRAFFSSLAAIIRDKVNITGNLEVDYWTITKAFPLGDQDIINALFASPEDPLTPWGHPEWLYIIPMEFNWCFDPPWLEDMTGLDVRKEFRARSAYSVEVRTPCIIHFCGLRLFPEMRGAPALDKNDPSTGAYSYVRNTPIEKREKAPGMRH